MRHIAAKLKIAPGMRVVEIGSGWGALAIYLAKACGATSPPSTSRPSRSRRPRSAPRPTGVADRVTFVEKDYRELDGKFDRVVSIGMMEHVGVAYFDDYFTTVKRLLEPGGFALVHAIGRMSPPGSTAPFIRKYIFPGGYVPALSEVFASTERTGLWVADCEVLRLHYYWTIQHWRERFAAERAAVVAMMGERFARMWEFYLAAVELGFLHGSNMVFQLLLGRAARRRAGDPRLHRRRRALARRRRAVSRAMAPHHDIQSGQGGEGAAMEGIAMRVARSIITGRVQGVGFRYFAERSAARHGLAGWVRNRIDGSVEAVAAGRTGAVEAMIADCQRGPSTARVEFSCGSSNSAEAELTSRNTGQTLLLPSDPLRAFSAKAGTGFAKENATTQKLERPPGSIRSADALEHSPQKREPVLRKRMRQLKNSSVRPVQSDRRTL